jgi:hypothetical protein
MRYHYTIHGRNTRPLWGYTRRQQGRQVRYSLDLGWFWLAVYVGA